MPKQIKRKIRRLARKKDENNIDNLIDLLCYTISEYKAKTKFSLLKEYGELAGINIEDFGYYFTYSMSKKRYLKILALIESNLDISDALVIGKIKKIEYKIGYLKQKRKAEI